MKICAECGKETSKLTRDKCPRCYQRELYADPEKRKKKNQRARKFYNRHREEELDRAKKSREKKEFDSMRAYILWRDKYTCVRCGFTGAPKDLQVHHKDRSGRRKEDHNNTPENLETLCRSCHLKEHHAETVASRLRNSAGVWSAKHAACIDCGRTSVKHAGNGRCRTCHAKWFRMGKIESTPTD